MFIEKIDRDELLKPLQTVVGIVERKQPLPILSNVLIEKNSTSIVFVATDLEIQISTKQSIESNSDFGTLTVSAKKLQEILRVLPDSSQVSLDIQENKLLIKANKSISINKGTVITKHSSQSFSSNKIILSYDCGFLSYFHKSIWKDINAVSNEVKSVSNDTEVVSNEAKSVSNDTNSISNETKSVSNDTNSISNDTEVVSNETKSVSNDAESVYNNAINKLSYN